MFQTEKMESAKALRQKNLGEQHVDQCGWDREGIMGGDKISDTGDGVKG